MLADVALYEGDADAALRHYDGEVLRARRDDDPIRLVWTLYYVAVCHAVLRAPEPGVAAAEESLRGGRDDRQPDGPVDGAATPLGLVLKKTDPHRALALFDEAGELAASVHNFWWHGIALMEAAATRAVHADPATAAAGASSRCSTTGTGWATGASSGSTCGTWCGCWSGSTPPRTRSCCTTRSSRPASRRRWTPPGSPTLAADLGEERFAAAALRGSDLTRSAAVLHAKREPRALGLSASTCGFHGRGNLRR